MDCWVGREPEWRGSATSHSGVVGLCYGLKEVGIHGWAWASGLSALGLPSVVLDIHGVALKGFLCKAPTSDFYLLFLPPPHRSIFPHIAYISGLSRLRIGQGSHCHCLCFILVGQASNIQASFLLNPNPIGGELWSLATGSPSVCWSFKKMSP